MTIKEKRTSAVRRQRKIKPLPPAIGLLLVVIICLGILQLMVWGFEASNTFEKKYAIAEEQIWTKPMPLLVTYGRKEVEVEPVVEKWYREISYGGLKQSGWTKGEFREPTAAEGAESPELKRTGESINIFFPVEPDTMRVCRWETGKESEKTELTLENGVLFLAPGEWIYGVEADWEKRKLPNGDWNGKAWYCFRANGPDK